MTLNPLASRPDDVTPGVILPWLLATASGLSSETKTVVPTKLDPIVQRTLLTWCRSDGYDVPALLAELYRVNPSHDLDRLKVLLEKEFLLFVSGSSQHLAESLALGMAASWLTARLESDLAAAG